MEMGDVSLVLMKGHNRGKKMHFENYPHQCEHGLGKSGALVLSGC